MHAAFSFAQDIKNPISIAGDSYPSEPAMSQASLYPANSATSQAQPYPANPATNHAPPTPARVPNKSQATGPYNNMTHHPLSTAIVTAKRTAKVTSMHTTLVTSMSSPGLYKASSVQKPTKPTILPTPQPLSPGQNHSNLLIYIYDSPDCSGKLIPYNHMPYNTPSNVERAKRFQSVKFGRRLKP